MANCFRITILAAVAGIFIWLALEPSVIDRRWSMIKLEIQRGHIGALPEKYQHVFEDNVRWLVPYAGVTTPVVINAPPQRGRLHFYTTTPAALAATGCARGNAIYDADLDAIFVDEQIVDPIEMPLLGEQGHTSLLDVEDLAFLPVYLRFVISHELGHRQLHHSKSVFFDKGNGTRVLEQQADDFAVTVLEKAYAADVVTGKRNIGESAAEMIAMDKNPTSAAERVWVDLLGSLYAISFAQMFSASDFSSFYSDTSHPNFVQRASRIFDRAVQVAAVAPILKSHARVFREALVRLQEFAGSSFTEIHCPDGVLHVALGDEDLSVMTATGSILTVPLSSLINRSSVDLKSIAKRRFTKALNNKAWLADVWASKGRGVTIVGPSPHNDNTALEVRSLHNGQLLRWPDLETHLAGKWSGQLLTPPQPAEFAVSNGTELCTIITENSVLALSWQNLRQTIAAAAGVTQIYAELLPPTADALHVAAFADDDKHRLIGVANFRLDGSLRHFTKINFTDERGGDFAAFPNDRIAAKPSGSGYTYFFCTRNRIHLLVFEMSETGPMRLLCSYPLIFERALVMAKSSDGLAAFDARMQAAWWVPTNLLLVQFAQDSVFRIDLVSRTCTPFFPGIIETNTCTGRNGDVIFFVENGLKLYLVRTSSINRSTMKTYRFWLIIGILAAAASAWWSFRLSHTAGIRFGAVAVAQSNGGLMLAYGYAMTVVGVFLGSAYRNLQERQKRGDPSIGSVRSFLRSVLISIDFWLGACASPLVYALLLRSTEGGTVSGLTAIALQNGFCCTVIASGLMAKGSSPANPP